MLNQAVLEKLRAVARSRLAKEIRSSLSTWSHLETNSIVAHNKEMWSILSMASATVTAGAVSLGTLLEEEESFLISYNHDPVQDLCYFVSELYKVEESLMDQGHVLLDWAKKYTWIAPKEKKQVETATVIAFPSLAAHVVTVNKNGSIGKSKELQINSQTGFPIETDLFVGNAILVLVPPQERDFNHALLPDNTRIHLQLQGKFKRQPKGTVYCGAEITKPVNVSPFMQGVYSVFLNILSRTFGSNMHYSFGSPQELPHIVFPATDAMDSITSTKLGDQAPPKLGEMLNEDSQHNWNTNDVFTMSFSSSRVDLPTWQIVNIRMPVDRHLESYWGKSLLRLVLYEQDSNSERHHVRDNNYLMTLQFEYLGDKERSSDVKGNEKE